MESRIVIPLDGISEDRAMEISGELSGRFWGVKVNDLLYTSRGPFFILDLKTYGKVFADPKLHDIPNTVANTLSKLVEFEPDLLTVHASGGIEMMKTAVEITTGTKTKVLGVTVLTSLDEDNAHLIYGMPVKAKVLQLARYAKLAGVHGIVCSPEELSILSKQRELEGLLKVIPGIRPDWYQASDDQKRTMTPFEAIRLGADLLVIGRPILRAKDLLEALEKTNAEVEEGLKAREEKQA